MFQAQAASLAVIHRSGNEIPGVLRDLWRLAGGAIARRRAVRDATPPSARVIVDDFATERPPG